MNWPLNQHQMIFFKSISWGQDVLSKKDLDSSLFCCGDILWSDVWITLGITPERSQWQRGGPHEPCKLLESSPSTSSRPREDAEMKEVWCSDYIFLIDSTKSIVDNMLFVEFFKVYLDFLNTGADKCPAANLTQRLKVIFLKTRCQVKVKFREKTLQSTTEKENCSNPTHLHPDSVQIVIIE